MVVGKKAKEGDRYFVGYNYDGGEVWLRLPKTVRREWEVAFEDEHGARLGEVMDSIMSINDIFLIMQQVDLDRSIFVDVKATIDFQWTLRYILYALHLLATNLSGETLKSELKGFIDKQAEHLYHMLIDLN